MKCPCVNCICMAICRLKPYYRLHQDCVLSRTYVVNELKQSNEDVFQEVYDILKPIRWNVKMSDYGLPNVMDRVEIRTVI